MTVSISVLGFQIIGASILAGAGIRFGWFMAGTMIELISLLAERMTRARA